MLLIFFGTLYQAEHGLYLAQKKFFDSLIIVDGFLVLPGVVLIMWLAFINLTAFLVFKFNYNWSKLGLFISHLGLVTLLLGGFYTLYYSKESLITVREGEQTNIAADYYKWQVRIVEKSLEAIIPFEIDSKNLSDDAKASFKKALPTLRFEKFYPNGQVFETPFAGTIAKELPLAKDFEQNQPLLIFTDIQSKEKVYLDDFNYKVLTSKNSDGTLNQMILERVVSELPISIRLEDVRRDLHPNTQVAKAYASTISVLDEGSKLSRKVEISMNKPFRYKDYTFFQSSYGIDSDGQEFSSFAVVKNAGRLVPYIASFLTTLGLIIHFIMQFLKFSRQRSLGGIA